MAANKFATMLHRHSNKITLILIYAVLEWILIVLLLLNSLFSYLIFRFADFFGLKPPCSWCTRIDHVIDPARGGKNSHRVHLCDAHAEEVSRLGFCSNHRKLVESRDMCEDCLSSRPEFEGLSKNFAVFPWRKEFGLEGEGEVSLNCCSCCGVSLDCNKYASCILLKRSWDVLEYSHEENLISEDCNHARKGCDSDEKISGFDGDLCDNEMVLNEENDNKSILEFDGKENGSHEGNFDDDLCDNEMVLNEENDNKSISEFDGKENCSCDYELNDKMNVVLEKEILEEETLNLVMIDKSVQVCVVEDASVDVFNPHLEFFLDSSGHTLVPIELVDSLGEGQKNQVELKEELFVENGEGTDELGSFIDVDINVEPEYPMLDSMEIEEDENALVFHAKGLNSVTKECGTFEVSSLEASVVQEPAEACEEVSQANNENDADVSIGTESPDLDVTDEIQLHDSVLHVPSENWTDRSVEEENHGSEQTEEHPVDLQPLVLQDRDYRTSNQSSAFQLELGEIEEDKVPDTPTSVDSLNLLHKKLMMLEKRDSCTEESIDGSVTSELEGSDGVATVERLQSALRSERKVLKVLYAELEEERSASAVAANQTMAMITRLQEEKAAMQMEALQYQRMMDEQSEYDQEALQLLNELMVKREKEKQELERELEEYKKKLSQYETKEKMRLLRRSSTGSRYSSASYSNAEDSDGLSIDLNQEAKEHDEAHIESQNAPDEAVVNLEESLADFEDERLSILDQLKVLEEKLLTLDEENGDHPEAMKNVDFNGETMNGISLLPLFDAVSDENGHATPSDSENIDTQNKKLVIEEEVDHLYERLQALETDREFLKHCITSLKKGDKGMDLLQEILQHLRDLRQVRNMGDGAIL